MADKTKAPPGATPSKAHGDIGAGMHRVGKIVPPGSIAGQSVGVPGDVEPDKALLIRNAKWIPPRGATGFFGFAEQDTAIVETINWVAAGQQFVMPDSHEGVVTFAQFFTTVADANFAGSVFTILLDSVPVPGWEAIPIFQAGGAQANAPGDAWIEVRERQTVQVRFTHAIAAAVHVGMQFRGHYWGRGGASAP